MPLFADGSALDLKAEAEGRRERTAGITTSVCVHALIALAAAWPLARPHNIAVPPAADSPEIFLIDRLPPDPPAAPGLMPATAAESSAPPSLDGSSQSLSVGGFQFELSKISQRAALLFPFVTPGLALDRFGIAAPRERHLQLPPGLLTPGSAAKAVRPPLSITTADLQAIVDRTWSRRDRWRVFGPIMDLADAHAPDQGQLPLLLREYAEQNGLQPYVDPGSPDPRLWTELALAADHTAFIGFISRYTSAQPGTRASVELLFLLDKLAFANRDALATLLTTDESALHWTRQANRLAHDFIVDLKSYYSAILRQRGLDDPQSLGGYYDTVRLQILNGIVETAPAGYRRGDAHFLIGTIYWKQGRRAEAIRAWRDASSGVANELTAAGRDVAAALALAGARPDHGVSEREINRILDAEAGRWFSFSIDRLKAFGYRLDSY
jgi:hypothetical protein